MPNAPLKIMIILVSEIIIYVSFLNLVFSRTYKILARRWKASAFIGIISGLVLQLLFEMLFIFGWLIRGGFNLPPDGIVAIFSQSTFLFTITAAYFSMPMTIVATFVAYLKFWQTGDRFIEKYWRNPDIHYEEEQKPPFLKF